MPPMRLIKCRRGIRWDPESIVVSGPSNTTMASLVVLLLERRLLRRALFLPPGRLVSSNHLGRGATQLYVVVAAETVVAAATPEETCDQEHPEEHPYQPGSAQHDCGYHGADHNQRC